jgi:hypothetical protein
MSAAVYPYPIMDRVQAVAKLVEESGRLGVVEKVVVFLLQVICSQGDHDNGRQENLVLQGLLGHRIERTEGISGSCPAEQIHPVQDVRTRDTEVVFVSAPAQIAVGAPLVLVGTERHFRRTEEP